MFEATLSPPPVTPDPADRHRLEAAASLPAGPAGVCALAALDPTRLDDRGRVAYLAAWERQAAWVAARQQEAILAVAGRTPSDEDDFSREEVSAALRLSPASAARRIAAARRLRMLPRTTAALRDGEIGFLHALAAAEETADLAPALLAEVEAVLYDGPPAASLAAFRRRLRRAVLEADPVGAELAHRQACTQREVKLCPEAAGMARLIALLRADEAAAVFAALTLAAGGDSEARAPSTPSEAPLEAPGIDARRADALVALVTGHRPSTPETAPKGAGGRRREARITVDLPTLLCLREAPGDLEGYGPVPPALARILAADADWRLLVTDPGTREVIDRGRRCYRPPAALAAFVMARDGTCRFPGCPRPAEECDLDHNQAYDEGGATDADNVTALCRRHHRMKTHAGWLVVRTAEGGCRWTSPVGARYWVPPPALA